MNSSRSSLSGNDQAIHNDETITTEENGEQEDLDDFSIASSGEEEETNHATLDAAMMNELLLVCSNLGMLRTGNESDVPVLMRGEDCEEWIHDLQRAIRRDHAKYKLVAKQLGKWKILQKKLIPLLVNHQHDWSLVFSILKVLVMLTMKPPRDSTNISLQLMFLREYKHAFLHERVIPIIMTILVEPLSKNGSARTPQDYLNMELVLTLIRNLLAIPNQDVRFVTSSTFHLSRLQQDLIRTLQEENVYEMMLLFAQDIDAAENREWNLLLMEMLDLTLTCSHPKLVATVTQETDKENILSTTNPPVSFSRSSLAHQLSTEKQLHNGLPSKRHSNFGGMMMLKGPSGRTTVLSNFTKMGDAQVPQVSKKPVSRKTGAARRGGSGSTQSHPLDVTELFAPKQSNADSDPITLNVLAQICDTLIEKSYFQLTNSLKGEFRRGSSKLVSTDRLQYFHLVWFLTTYHRFKMQNLKAEYRRALRQHNYMVRARKEALDFDSTISEPPSKPELNEKAVLTTLDMFSFNFVLQSIESYATTKNYHAMTVSVKLLTEMMTYLSELAGSEDARYQRIAHSLQHKIFYERDFLDRLPVLLKTWTPGLFSMEYVIDVITLTHIVFKILDSQGSIKVLSRRKALLDQKRKKAKKTITNENGENEDDQDDSENEEESERQLILEMQRKEADFDVRRYFQTILSFETIKMYTCVLQQYRHNSTKVNHYVHSFFYRVKHFRIFKDSINDDSAPCTMQPMLFNIHVILVFNNMLQDTQLVRHKPECQPFLAFIRGVVVDFFALAEKNRLLFVEALLRQPYASKSCQLLQRTYEPLDVLSRSKANAVTLGRQEKLDRITDARRQKKAMDAEELEGETEFQFSLDTTHFESTALQPQSQVHDRSEEDENLTKTMRPTRPRRSRTAIERAKNWTNVEDRYLKKVYFQYRHLPSVYEVISYEDMFQDRDRTADQIERRVKYLKLHRNTDDEVSEKEGDNLTDNTINDPNNERQRGEFSSNKQILPHQLESEGDVNPEAALERLNRATKRVRRRLRRGVDSSDDDEDDFLTSRAKRLNDSGPFESDVDLFECLSTEKGARFGKEAEETHDDDVEKPPSAGEAVEEGHCGQNVSNGETDKVANFCKRTHDEIEIVVTSQVDEDDVEKAPSSVGEGDEQTHICVAHIAADDETNKGATSRKRMQVISDVCTLFDGDAVDEPPSKFQRTTDTVFE